MNLAFGGKVQSQAVSGAFQYPWTFIMDAVESSIEEETLRERERRGERYLPKQVPMVSNMGAFIIRIVFFFLEGVLVLYL